MTVATKSSVGRLLAALSPAQQLVALARVLHTEGYDDHTTGHITLRQPDGTFLVNPFELQWNELRPSDVMRMDAEGHALEGPHTVTPAISLHVELHKAKADLHVAVHGHPRWATAWACAQRIPPVYDQTSAFAGRSVALYAEYAGSVDAVANARAAVQALGDEGVALLANHGVLVVASSIAEAYMRAATIEWRAHRAWQVESLGGGPPLADEVVDALDAYVRANLDGFPTGNLEAMVRQELRRDPRFLDEDPSTA
jgi:ribulose-5-phosphate 4-epimerase/fuculose-1-phosphate aldolase